MPSFNLPSLLSEETAISSGYLDPDKMMLVLINLFTNAIEASQPNGTVSVLLRHYEKKLCIDISDRGAGIPETIRERIFDPFVTGKKKGTGLGLPICRKIVEAHSGKLTCRSTPGGGTTFSISLSCLPTRS
jgi:two-component system sensor histidine kinase HydH